MCDDEDYVVIVEDIGDAPLNLRTKREIENFAVDLLKVTLQHLQSEN